MVTVEASVPVSSRFIDPAVTAIPPDSDTPSAIDTGVVLDTVRAVIVELASTSTPRLSDEVLALPKVIEFRRSLLFALLKTRLFVLVRVPPPRSVSVFAPMFTAAPSYVRVLSVNTSIVMSPD